jgi:hypothetical protein
MSQQGCATQLGCSAQIASRQHFGDSFALSKRNSIQTNRAYPQAIRMEANGQMPAEELLRAAPNPINRRPAAVLMLRGLSRSQDVSVLPVIP